MIIGLDLKHKQQLMAVVGALLSCFCTFKIFAGQSEWLMFPAAMAGFIVLLSMRKYWYNLLLVLTMMPGRSPMLKGIGYWEGLAAFVCLMWLLDYIITKKNVGRLVGWPQFLLIAGFCGVFIWHIIGRKIGVFGGSSGGKRIAVVAVLTIVSCFIIQTQSFDMRGVHLLPEFGLVPGGIKGGIEIVNFLVPSAIYVTFYIYQDINWEAIYNVATSGRIQVSRLAELRAIALSLVLLCCAKLPTESRLLSRRGMLILAGIVLSFVLALFCGYRKYIVICFFAVLISCWCRNRRLLLPVIAGIVLCIVTLVFVQNTITPLPFAVQRVLSWVPGGHWASSIVAETNQGLLWRTEIWQKFMDFVFPDHMWFGRGQHFVEGESSLTQLYDQQYIYYYGQMLHSGFFSLLDYVGIVGGVFFLLASLRSYYSCFQLLTKHTHQLRPWMLWIIMIYVIQQPFYWLTYGFANYFFSFAIFMSSIEVIYQTCTHAHLPEKNV